MSKKKKKKRDKIRSRARYLGVGRVLACMLLGSCALACILAFTGRVGSWPCVGGMVKGPYVGLLVGYWMAACWLVYSWPVSWPCFSLLDGRVLVGLKRWMAACWPV